jgi:hypothetical protein
VNESSRSNHSDPHAGQLSPRPARALVFLLRLLACIDLLALAALALPHALLAKAHAWAGLGTLPEIPVVGYLARSASLLYALHGAVVLFISFDLVRYWRFITFLAAVACVHGALLLGIDLAEGMPLWWTILEGPAIVVAGIVVLGLQRLCRPWR